MHFIASSLIGMKVAELKNRVFVECGRNLLGSYVVRLDVRSRSVASTTPINHGDDQADTNDRMAPGKILKVKIIDVLSEYLRLMICLNSETNERNIT
jgi:hypothetical protein